MENKKNNTIFLGGFTGVVKNEKYSTFGKNFYRLTFAMARDDDAHFGYETASVSVSDATYKEFLVKAKPNSFVDARVMYVRGGYTLIDYNL